jgi:hypothetical protein
VFYIILGLVLMLVAGFLASNYRGFGARYILIALRKKSMSDDQIAKTVMRYRTVYGIGSFLGLCLVVSGIARL